MHADLRFADLTAGLSAQTQGLVNEALTRGILPSAGAAEIMAQTGCGIDQLMVALLPIAAACAHTPISNYAVGAVVLGLPRDGGPGHLYLGANFEFAGQILSFTVHAEQSAVNNAWIHGEHGIVLLAASSAPCGMCRQFLAELTTNRTLSIVTPGGRGRPDAGAVQHLANLLPHAFGPDDLGVQGGMMRDEQQRFKLDTEDPLTLAALAACNASYAPYTGAHAGIALRDSSGTIHSGRYAENAAYNPSLLAVQSALASAALQSCRGESLPILDAVFVERSSGRTSQRATTQLIVEALAPGAKLRCLPV